WVFKAYIFKAIQVFNGTGILGSILAIYHDLFTHSIFWNIPSSYSLLLRISPNRKDNKRHFI
ncbi:MAG: hypothetical protein ACKPFK_23940, partial [Dolichospermum sp.]